MVSFKIIQLLFLLCSLQKVFASENNQLIVHSVRPSHSSHKEQLQEGWQKDERKQTTRSGVKSIEINFLPPSQPISKKLVNFIKIEKTGVNPSELDSALPEITIAIHSDNSLPSETKDLFKSYSDSYNERGFWTNFPTYMKTLDENDPISTKRFLEAFYSAALIPDFIIEEIRTIIPQLKDLKFAK